MTGRFRSGVVTLFVAVMVVTTVVAATDVTSTENEGPNLPSGDEIYIEDDGDAVLVHKDDSGGSRGSLGLNTSKGLVHMLVETDFNGSTDIKSNVTAILTSDSFTGNGTLSVPRPEALSNLSVDVTGKRTDTAARLDANASATITGQTARSRTVFEQARIAGNATLTASSFDAAAEAHVQLARSLPSRQLEFRITEQDGTYTVEASQKHTVSGLAARRWSTRTQAKRTLTRQYSTIASSLGGTVDLTLDSYSFTKSARGYQLDIEYTVTYHNIESKLLNRLASRLSATQDIDLTRSETRKITQQLRKFNVNEVYVRYNQHDRSIDAAMRIDLENYDKVVTAALDTAASTIQKNSKANTTLQQFRTTFEAQQDANLKRQYKFAASYKQGSNQNITVNTELHYRTENWKQYVKELSDQGIKSPEMTYELHATTSGENVTANASVEVTQKNLLRGVSNQLLNSTSKQGSGRTTELLTAFKESGFRKARMDYSMHDGQIRFEAGAAFKNMSGLLDALEVTKEGQAIQSAVSRVENDTTTEYIRINNAVGENPTKSEIRELPYVTEDTAIHMSGSWDKTFPKMNTTQASEYLALEDTSTGSGLDVTSLTIAGAALLAIGLVGAGIVMARRW